MLKTRFTSFMCKYAQIHLPGLSKIPDSLFGKLPEVYLGFSD